MLRNYVAVFLKFNRMLLLVLAVGLVSIPEIGRYTAYAAVLEHTEHDGYKAYLEEKYGFAIYIDDSIKENFYPERMVVDDYAFRVLREIEAAFTLLPEGFVREVADIYRSEGHTPTIVATVDETFEHGGRTGWGGYFSSATCKIAILKGNSFITHLLHEFGHAVYYCVRNFKSKADITNMEQYFLAQNKASGYPYEDAYESLKEIDLDTQFYDSYISEYASRNFSEDFAETFSDGVFQYRYLSGYGSGDHKPIHNKIEALYRMLENHFSSIRDGNILMNALPDAVPAHAASEVVRAKQAGIIPWSVYGLNTGDITRYDLALLLRSFLYKYIDEPTLLKKAGLASDFVIPADFSYDALDNEDIFLLHHLSLMTVDEEKRFNPSEKVQRQALAVSYAKLLKHLGIATASTAPVSYVDSADVGDWAKPDVHLVTTLHILSLDAQDFFYPEQYVTYQEVYLSLLRISDLIAARRLYLVNTAGDGNFYHQLGDGIYIADNGRLHLNQDFAGFTGRGIYTWRDGNVYKGEWTDGNCNGTGTFTWAESGTVYEGDFVDGKRTGKGRLIWGASGNIYEGDFVNGERTGKGRLVWVKSGDVYEGDFVDNKRSGYGIYQWGNGDVYMGDWLDDKRTGKGVFIWAETGDEYEGDFVNGMLTGYGVYRSNTTGITKKGYFENGVLIRREY